MPSHVAYVFTAPGVYGNINAGMFPPESGDNLFGDASYFRQIRRLDHLVRGGEVAHQRRTLVGPNLTDAETIIQVGNAVVMNRSRGWHPDYQTVILSEGTPDTDVVERFTRFYQKPPTVIPTDSKPESLEEFLPVHMVEVARGQTPKVFR